MSKKLTDKEREELAQELTSANYSFDLDILGPTKERRKSSKTPIEKVKSYNLMIENSVFWASRQVYLELLQSFLLERIDGEILTSKFFELRIKDIMNAAELCAIIEDQISPIPDLYYTFKAKDFSSVIDDLYFEIDRYSPYIENSDWNEFVYSESKLRSVIQEKFVPILQKCCDLNSSFFQPQVDLE